MSGASLPVGRCTLLVNHHGISQPNPASWRLASSSQDLSGPCYSHHRVVHDAEAQRLMEYLYTPRYCYISPLCFTAQRRLEVHDPCMQNLLIRIEALNVHFTDFVLGLFHLLLL